MNKTLIGLGIAALGYYLYKKNKAKPEVVKRPAGTKGAPSLSQPVAAISSGGAGTIDRPVTPNAVNHNGLMVDIGANKMFIERGNNSFSGVGQRPGTQQRRPFHNLNIHKDPTGIGTTFVGGTGRR
jgi:hypothetical protein